jgi:predicted phage terminase large subunit-like protein
MTVALDLSGGAAGFEAALRKALRSDLVSWAAFAVSRLGLRPAAHHLLLLEHLQKLTRGDIDRLMVLMPPGSAKSTYTSVLFPPWWFIQHPSSSVIGASHTASLALQFSKRVRNTIDQHSARLGYSVEASSRAVSYWRTETGGEYYAAGTRGTVVGRRADLVIIDDPLKSQAEADSPFLRDRIWDWYQSDLTTRLKPAARIILIMTRWHEDDLGGRLLTRNEAEWNILRLPALAEDNDPLGRLAGTPLWPEWENGAALARKRQSVGERTWSALFQQNPVPPTGGLFEVSRIRPTEFDQNEADTLTVRAWDLAATASTGTNDPDWSVGLKLTRDARGMFTILDVVRLRGTPLEVEEAVVATADRDGQSVVIGLPEDPGQAGKSQVAYFTSRLAGFTVSTSRETGSKESRAAPVASQVSAGNFCIARGKWTQSLLDELRLFPFGRKDDQVDALSRAFNLLIMPPKSARRVNVPLLFR